VGIFAWASIIVGFVTALSSLWPAALQEPFRSCLILGIVGSLGVLNIVGIKIFKYVNNVVTIAKLIPLLLFVSCGVFSVETSNYSPSLWQDWEPQSFGAAALVIFYAFGGFETLVVAAGEMKNPRKNLPLAVMLVIAFCSFLYFVIQMIAIGILGEGLANSVNPLADAAHSFLGDSGKWSVTMVMLISIGGVNLTASFITPRSGVALAEDGMIPRKIAHKGRFGTPVWAILVTLALTGVLALTGNFAQLVVISVISRFAQYVTTSLAVLVLRKRINPTESRLQQLLFSILPMIALIGVSWLILQATLIQLIWGLGALIIGIPLYWLQRRMPEQIISSPAN
jgi:amino acid transporter